MNMCRFRYYRYDNCGHTTIEVAQYCIQRVWKAGFDGELWACPEERYMRHMKGLSSITWDGMQGYCKLCQQKYAIPEMQSFPSVNDFYVPAVKPSLRTSFDHPYIFLPYLARTIPELLGTAIQYRAKGLNEGPTAEFWPAVLGYGPRYDGSKYQWLSLGYCDGQRISSDRPLYSTRDDMTENDVVGVARAIIYEHDLYALWRQEFKDRGMRWARFFERAKEIREGKF